MIKFNRVFIGSVLFMPGALFAAPGTDFNMAAQLLSAARNGNTRLVQNLINSGANVNYVDSTGVSVVCTAVMNNDVRAVQVLQMYGADASQCDRQIKNYRARTNPVPESGLFAGLSSSHKLLLATAGGAAIIGGLLWATDAFDSSNGNSSSSSNSGGHTGGGSGSGGSNSGLTAAWTVPYSPAYLNTNGTINASANVSANEWVTTSGQMDFDYMRTSGIQNYLLIAHGYDLFANRYNGQEIFRNSSDLHNPLLMSGVATDVGGGTPATVALVTANGINNADGSLARGGGISKAASITGSVEYVDKYKNYVNSACDGNTCSGTENITNFVLSGHSTAVENTSATDEDNNIAKIVAGWLGGRDSGDLYGFIPYGTLAVYRTGGGKNNLDADIPYYNYQAMSNVATNGSFTPDVIANVSQNLNSLTQHNYATLSAFNVSTVTFSDLVTQWYGSGQGAIADTLFGGYNSSSPIMINSVGGYQVADFGLGEDVIASFENYAPLAYSNKIDNNFMSVVAVQHSIGTSGATSVNSYGDGTGNSYGKIQLSEWDNGTYRSRICGIAGTGTNGVDPWCFAAPGDIAEYAVASMAGAVASLKKAFTYMSNQQIFSLLALTADGAYLGTNPSTGKAWGTTETEATNNLVSYLKTKYTMSAYNDVLTGESYLDAFKQVFGYGLINLERATTPNKSVYYYTDGKIVSAAGNAYWRAATNSVAHMSSAFGARAATVPVSFYDVVTAADNSISVPRVWNMELSLGTDASHGLYLGDTLAELKTHDVDNSVTVGNFKFGLARSEKFYDDNMGGIDNMSLEYNNDRFGFISNYQRYLTDGAGRFSGNANPVLSLFSNAVATGAEFKHGRFSIMGRAFIGEITNEDLLENDPVVSNNFAAAKLGSAFGAESGSQFNGEKLSLQSNIGTMHENGTVLGSQFVGLLGDTDTNYVDAKLKYNVTPDVDFSLRGTFAWTDTNGASNGIINGISELKSNAFAANVRFKNFDLTVSAPLALIDGRLNYSHADFVVDDNNNLQIKNAGEYAIDLTPEKREYRFNASYRHKFGDWTDGALGFIYRINPNNTDEFGNESIFMMKLSHRLGI